MLTKEERNNELVKSLLDSGFDEDVIKSWIDSGELQIEKSESDPDDEEEEGKEPDNESGDDRRDPESDPDDEEEEGDEEEEEENSKKSCGKKGCGKGDIEKSLDEVRSDIVKSIQAEVETQFDTFSETIQKSIEDAVEAKVSGVLDRIEKSLDSMVRILGNQVPGFKGAGLTRAVIEKSLGGGKDDENKVVLSVSRDREAVRELISKSIAEETDATLHKSLVDGTREYLIDPLFGEINREAAQYMFDKKGVRLVK